jgi:hypothetical protein
MHGGDGFHPGWADATRLRCVIVMPAGWGSDRWLDQRDARSYEELGGERSRLPEQSDARPGASPARLTLPTASPRDCGSRQVKPACWHDQRGHRCGQVILLDQEFPPLRTHHRERPVTRADAAGYRNVTTVPNRVEQPRRVRLRGFQRSVNSVSTRLRRRPPGRSFPWLAASHRHVLRGYRANQARDRGPEYSIPSINPVSRLIA